MKTLPHLAEAYAEGQTAREIAVRYKTSRYFVYNQLKLMGIDIRNTGPRKKTIYTPATHPEDIEAQLIEAKRKAKTDPAQLAALTGATEEKVREYAKELSILNRLQKQQRRRINLTALAIARHWESSSPEAKLWLAVLIEAIEDGYTLVTRIGAGEVQTAREYIAGPMPMTEACGPSAECVRQLIRLGGIEEGATELIAQYRLVNSLWISFRQMMRLNTRQKRWEKTAV